MKIVQIGCGKMSKYTMRYAMEKGAQIVGAYDINPKLIGKDISCVLGGAKRGVIIEDVKTLMQSLPKKKANCALITTRSLLLEIEDAVVGCVKSKVNVVTICEEAFYSWNSNPKLTKKIDKLAKEYGVTVCGSGYQDVSWGSLVLTACSTTQKIKKIVGTSSYNVEDYGIALATVHGAGLTKAQFKKEIESVNNVSHEKAQELIKKGDFLPSYMWNVNGWLCSALGLTPVSTEQKTIMQTCAEDLTSKTLNLTIKKGNATGMSAKVITKTKEGITLENECIGKVYAQGETDINRWTILGEPNTTINVEKPSTVEMTCASAIHRIPSVVKAPAGFISSDKLEPLKYFAKF